MATRPALRVDHEVLDAVQQLRTELRALADLHEDVRQLRREIRGLSLPTHASQAPSTDDVRLVQVIASAIHGCVFSSAELMAHRAVHEPLRAALEASGIHTAQQVGKRLRRLQGRPHGAFVVARHGTDASGAIWSVSLVEQP